MAVKVNRSEPSYRSELRQWIWEQVEGRHEVVLPELTAKAVDHFKRNQDFMSGLAQEVLQPAVYEIAKEVLSGTRRRTFQLGEIIVDEVGLEKRAEQQAARWPRWLENRYEYSGGRHLLALEMTRIDLEAAADERELRGKRELAVAELWRAIAARMDANEPVTVADWFKGRQGELDKIWGEVRASHPELHE